MSGKGNMLVGMGYIGIALIPDSASPLILALDAMLLLIGAVLITVGIVQHD